MEDRTVPHDCPTSIHYKPPRKATDLRGRNTKAMWAPEAIQLAVRRLKRQGYRVHRVHARRYYTDARETGSPAIVYRPEIDRK